jgi:predicted AAA+ superfamily ATPase
MEEQQIKKLEESISNLEKKSSRIYVMIQDTKGNPKASVRYMYQFA